MSSEALTTQRRKLPGAMGDAVWAYYTQQYINKLPLPDPEISVDMLDVAHTVMNHTNAHPLLVFTYLPQIKELMSELREEFS